MKKKDIELIDFVVTARKYKTTLTRKYLNRKSWEQPNEGLIKALLPGTVLSIEVKAGDIVKAGDLLLVQEAMKMRNEILAPFDGKIKEVFVAVNTRVPKDCAMVEFDNDYIVVD